MKKLVSFRLDRQTLNILDQLNVDSGLSKTEIVEKALQHYYQTIHDQETKHHSLLNHAGVLSDNEAKTMLQAITDSKTIKDSDFEL